LIEFILHCSVKREMGRRRPTINKEREETKEGGGGPLLHKGS